MNKSLFLPCFALLLSIAGCAGMSPEDNQRFQAEINRNVSVNMPLSEATGHLTKLGIACDDRNHGSEITCTREKTGVLLSYCLQRVNLAADSERKTVVAVTSKPIVCTGF
jgi:hypothetical protein